MTVDGDGASFLGRWNVLELLWHGDGHTTLNTVETMELYALSGCALCVNYGSIRLLLPPTKNKVEASGGWQEGKGRKVLPLEKPLQWAQRRRRVVTGEAGFGKTSGDQCGNPDKGWMSGNSGSSGDAVMMSVTLRDALLKSNGRGKHDRSLPAGPFSRCFPSGLTHLPCWPGPRPGTPLDGDPLVPVSRAGTRKAVPLGDTGQAGDLSSVFGFASLPCSQNHTKLLMLISSKGTKLACFHSLCTALTDAARGHPPAAGARAPGILLGRLGNRWF